MRKIKLSVANSLDNYIARTDGGYDWIRMDEDYGFEEFFGAVDTVLIGRKMHDLMVNRGIPAYKGMKNYVFSHSHAGESEDGVSFVSENKRDFVHKLRHTPGKDIWLAGGGELIVSFLQAGLVDQVALGVQPVLLGEGIPLFPSNFPQTNLRLIECKSYASGVVMLTYDVVR
jgi:dihydrofolate reductase